jgi:hypothetical protein
MCLVWAGDPCLEGLGYPLGFRSGSLGGGHGRGRLRLVEARGGLFRRLGSGDLRLARLGKLDGGEGGHRLAPRFEPGSQRLRSGRRLLLWGIHLEGVGGVEEQIEVARNDLLAA